MLRLRLLGLGLGLGSGLGFGLVLRLGSGSGCAVFAWAVGGTREKPLDRSDESISHAAHLVRVWCG